MGLMQILSRLYGRVLYQRVKSCMYKTATGSCYTLTMLKLLRLSPLGPHAPYIAESTGAIVGL